MSDVPLDLTTPDPEQQIQDATPRLESASWYLNQHWWVRCRELFFAALNVPCTKRRSGRRRDRSEK